MELLNQNQHPNFHIQMILSYQHCSHSQTNSSNQISSVIPHYLIKHYNLVSQLYLKDPVLSFSDDFIHSSKFSQSMIFEKSNGFSESLNFM